MKGIQKIKWSGKGKIDVSKSKPNVTLAVLPKNDIGFVVDKWLNGTTEEDKKKNVTWILQDKNRKEIRRIQKSPKEEYTLNIPNALCGPYTYYLEASFSGIIDRKNKTGLWITGTCTPRVINSKWSTTVDGADVRKKLQFKYGQLIYLSLETEGLNGSTSLTVEVYKVIEGSYITGREKDKLVATFTNVAVIDGEVNLKMGNTASWFVHAKKDEEQFYVKVKTNWGSYVSDGKDTMHARFLRIKKKQVTKAVEPSTNNTPLKIGDAEKNFLNYNSCRYDKVVAKYSKGEENFEIKIFPPSNSKSTNLKFPLVAGVKEARQRFSIELGGVKTQQCRNQGNKLKDHTNNVIDISGMKQLLTPVNSESSNKLRAYDYIGKGSGAVKNEQANDENDNSKIDESHMSHKFKFINGISSIKYQNAYKVLEQYTPFRLTEPTDEKLELEIGYDFSWGKTISPLTGLSSTLWPNKESIAQKYKVGLNTCANSLPIEIQVYPDTKWTIQLAYNYDADEFNELREAYHDKWAIKELKADDDLRRLKAKEEGIPDKAAKNERKKNQIKKADIRKKTKKAENEKLKAKKKKSKLSQAKHLMSNKTATGLIDCDFGLICEFDRPFQAIELTTAFDEGLNFLKKIINIKELVQNIVEGKNKETSQHKPTGNKKTLGREKILKERLDSKKNKSNWSFEFIPPSVAFSLSWYAELPKDLNTPVMGTMIEGAIDLNPLFGFEIKYDVYQLLYKLKHPAVLAVVGILDVLDEALGDNFDINLDLIVSSEISGSLKGTINTAEGSRYTKRLMKDEDDSPCKFGGKVEVSLEGYIQANGEFNTFLFGKCYAYGEISAAATTGISIECVTKADDKGIYVEPELKFEGFVLETKVNAGAGKSGKNGGSKTIEIMKEENGFHYGANGKIVILDPYEWETGWKLPIISL
jgi:hypothetical protein